MSSRKPPRTQTTRAARKRKDLLLRAGVWIFIFIFAFSIVGGLLAAGILIK